MKKVRQYRQLLFIALMLAMFSGALSKAQAATFALGTTVRVEGPAMGIDSVALGVTKPANGSWEASTATSWLHLNAASQSGVGSTNVVFSYDVNAGATRTGDLTIAGITVAVIQAGTNYIAAALVTNLVDLTSIGYDPFLRYVAVDNNMGNLFISDGNLVWEWNAVNGNLTLVAFPDANGSGGLAVDSGDNLYIADTGANVIKMLPAGGTLSTPLNVVSAATGLSGPQGVAVDGVGDLFIADSGNLAIKVLGVNAASPQLLAYQGLPGGAIFPFGVSVDAAGDVYAPSYYDDPYVAEVQAGEASWLTLTGPYAPPYEDNPAYFFPPYGAVGDGSGSAYIADSNGGLRKWTAASNTLGQPIGPVGNVPVASIGVAVDSVGYIYSADFYYGQHEIDYLPYAFVDTSPVNVPQLPGADQTDLIVRLPPIVPGTANLNGPFAPTCDQPWMSISIELNDVMALSVQANLGPPRTGHINVLGQRISVLQAGSSYILGATSVFEPPTAGSDRVGLTVIPNVGKWTATANDTWLHLTPVYQSGAGSTNMVFSFDANPGITRTGSLTIAGQLLTVTQMGATYLGGEASHWLVTGLVSPSILAVDSAGNVYIGGGGRITEWQAATGTTITLVSSGLIDPRGVAVDGAGDLFIADGTGNAIYELPLGGVLKLLPTSPGLNDPTGVAVDGADDLFIADSGDNTIYELLSGSTTLTPLVTSGLNDPTAVAVDGAGDLFIADSGDNTIYELLSGSITLTPLVTAGLNDPTSVAVDESGDLFISDSGDNALYELPFGGTLTLISSDSDGVAVDATGNLYFSDSGLGSVEEMQHAFVDTTPKSESAAAGSDVLPAVAPRTADLSGQFMPTSDQPWLGISSVANGVVDFTFQANLGTSRTAHITVLGEAIDVTQSGPRYTLGTTSPLEGPAAGIDSVVLATIPAIATWTATANASWLHLNQASQSGTGPANVIFSYDANPGATRTGTLDISGQTLSVTQAGATYVATGVNGLANLVPWTDSPLGPVVDGAGNLYFADPASREIEEWTVADRTVTTLVPSSAGLSFPYGLAVDGAGNVYITDIGNNAIEEWPANGNSLITLVSSAAGLNTPESVAVDSAGNVYIADTGNAAIKRWTAANGMLTTLVSGLNAPSGVAVDAAGNVYIADMGAPAVYEWIAASDQTITFASSPQVSQPRSVAVDGAGNVYIADGGNNAIVEWSAASNTLATLAPGLNQPLNVAADGAGNIYFVAVGYNGITELPHAFVDPTPKFESTAGGSDALPAVLPATANLAGPFAPGSDQSWLSITGIANGVVGFDFPANTTASALTAHITLLGQSITIVQNGPYSLSTYTRVEGPGAGNDSVILIVGQGFPAWTSSANESWLHVSQNGTGNASVVFSYDPNPGVTRTGSLTIAGETLTVTQAASTYVQTELMINLVSSGLNQPNGVAVDSVGNVYIADTGNNAIEEWTVANHSLTTLVSAAQGLSSPSGVAVDGTGNVYIADTGNNAIEEWPAGGNSLINVVSSTWGLNNPNGVAVDTSGNVYIADTGNNEIVEWTAANNNVTTLVSSALGLNGPEGVAVDVAGNVYIADTGNYAIEEWTPAGGLTTLTAYFPQFIYPSGVAVDIAGNAYIADSFNDAIEEWTPAQGLYTLLGIDQPSGVAVDGTGNVFIANTGNNSIDELPYAFVDPTPKFESAAAGSDALPIVLPSTANLTGPFTPASDQPWLTLTAQDNGVVAFSFTANTGPDRTANITLFDQSIPVLQAGIVTTPMTIMEIQMPEKGVIQFTFTSAPGASFTVLSTTNLLVPLCDWTVVGAPISISAGVFQFTSQQMTGDPQRFYAIRSP